MHAHTVLTELVTKEAYTATFMKSMKTLKPRSPESAQCRSNRKKDIDTKHGVSPNVTKQYWYMWISKPIFLFGEKELW